jgi:aminoglycoside phosphotransferase
MTDPATYISEYLTQTELSISNSTHIDVVSRNIIIKTTSINGDSYITKIDPTDEELLSVEYNVLTYLNSIDFPAPAVTEYIESELYTALTLPFYDSHPINWTNKDIVQTFMTDFGSIVDRFHSLDPTVIEEKTDATIPRRSVNDRVEHNIESAITELEDSGQVQHIPLVESVGEKLREVENQDERQGYMHGDFHLPNLLTATDGSIEYLLDYEMTQVGDRAYSFAKLFARVHYLYSKYTPFTVDELQKQFFKQYTHPFSESYRRAIYLYTILYLLKGYGRVYRTGMFQPWQENPYISDSIFDRQEELAELAEQMFNRYIDTEP